MGVRSETLKNQLDLVHDKFSLNSFLALVLAEMDLCFECFNENFRSERCEIYQLDDDLRFESHDVSGSQYLSGEAAERIVKFAITKTKRLDSQHGKRTYRLPGVVIVDDEIISQLEAISTLKKYVELAMFDELVIEKRQRGSFFQKNVKPGVVLKELYRKPVVINDAVKSLSFTWGKHVMQTYHWDRNELLDYLQEQYKDNFKPRPLFANYVLSEIDSVNRQPKNVIFRSIRSVAPHPRVNIVLENGVSFQKHANLPIFISKKYNADNLIQIRGLGSGLFNRRKVRELDKPSRELLISRLNLFVEK